MKMNTQINWQRLLKVQELYSQIGYKYIDVPWLVSAEASAATFPDGVHVEMLGDRQSDLVLSGSGEQGFIQLMLDKKLEQGTYQTLTPCFRKEAEYDDLTRAEFMKVELIRYLGRFPTEWIDDVFRARLDAYTFMMAETALSVFRSFEKPELLLLEKTDIGWDVMHWCMPTNIELGSYGWRTFQGHCWVYGTGIAEPRFSAALHKR